MLKEIHEEPDAVLRTLRPRVRDGLPALDLPALDAAKLRGLNRLIIVGCGTAMHAGLVGKGAIERLARLPVEVAISSEFRYADPILTEKDLVVLISQSGETADSLAALRLAKARGAATLGVVNAVGSSIAREADAVLYTWAGPEIAVASTKAFTVQLVAMYLLALAAALARETIAPAEAEALVGEMLTAIPEAIRQVIGRKEEIQAWPTATATRRTCSSSAGGWTGRSPRRAPSSSRKSPTFTPRPTPRASSSTARSR
jgi:glucosamine--fructose-6-phosphate aminotransferase (isomerizing)